MRPPTPPDIKPLPEGPFPTILADPPWRFENRTGKVAPELSHPADDGALGEHR